MRRQRSSRLRGSVTQNNMSVRMRAEEQTGVGFLSRLGLLLGGVLVVVFTVLWLWHVGWIQGQARKAQEALMDMTRKAHFAVADVVVEGRRMSDKDAVFDALGTQQGAPIFAFDARDAAARLGKLPWVGSALVERRLPGIVSVVLTERQPVARWQHDEKLSIIDADGRILPAAKPDDFPGLPLVVGMGADRAAVSFLALLKQYPDILSRTDSVVRVGERRWDLHVQPKITVRLPEQDVGAALHRLSVLIAQEKILDRAIVAVDLRIPDRLIVEPATGAKPTGAKL